MKYATIDANGMTTGFYNDDQPLPQIAFPITDMQYNDWLANQSTRQWSNGNLTVIAPVVTPLSPIQQLKQSNDQFAYVADVMIDVLLAKNVIAATDFPASIRQLYVQRKALRQAAGV